jgi:hypothetical protein
MPIALKPGNCPSSRYLGFMSTDVADCASVVWMLSSRHQMKTKLTLYPFFGLNCLLFRPIGAGPINQR